MSNDELKEIDGGVFPLVLGYVVGVAVGTGSVVGVVEFLKWAND
ncbi:class IIb bacteriocin, lactobin A/cerein 7B family [Reichenbachiella sp. 5M10]|nr:class IIb bacteriocin, lactobin A/cerein 7B family [Reichenbachiella sp. 5M10]